MRNFFSPPVRAAFLSLVVLASCTKKPEACFSVDKGSLSTKVNEEIQLNATCSNDASTFTWDFGDGSAAETGATTKHKYTKAGTYTIALTAEHKSRTDKVTKQVIIAP